MALGCSGYIRNKKISIYLIFYLLKGSRKPTARLPEPWIPVLTGGSRSPGTLARLSGAERGGGGGGGSAAFGFRL